MFSWWMNKFLSVYDKDILVFTYLHFWKNVARLQEHMSCYIFVVAV